MGIGLHAQPMREYGRAMNYRKRYPPSNSVTVHFDPITWEKLMALSQTGQQRPDKIVYLATLKALESVTIASEPPTETDDENSKRYDWSKVAAFRPLD